MAENKRRRTDRRVKIAPKIKEPESLAELISQSGGLTGIIKHAYTALIPTNLILTMIKRNHFEEKQPKSRFAKFIYKNSVQEKFNLFLFGRQISKEILKKIATHTLNSLKINVTDSWQKTMKSTQGKIKKMVYESGQVIYKIKDGTSNLITNNALVRVMAAKEQKKQATIANLNKRTIKTNTLSPQDKFFRKKMLTKNSIESELFKYLIKPKGLDNKIVDDYHYGWEGIERDVFSLPVPEKYSSTTNQLIMGYTAKDRIDGYIGVLVGKVMENKEDTFKSLLKTALQLNLKIPPRVDDRNWVDVFNKWDYEERSPEDIKMLEKTFLLSAKSPFITNDKMTNGMNILINDETLIHASKINSGFSPNSIAKNINTYKKERIESLEAQLLKYPDKDVVDKIKKYIDLIKNTRETITGYNSNKIKEDEEKWIIKKSNNAPIQVNENIDISGTWGDDMDEEEENFGRIDNKLKIENINEREEVNFLTAKNFGLELTPKNTKINIDEDNGQISLIVKIGDEERDVTGLSKLKNISNASSIPPYHLNTGKYKTECKSNKNIEFEVKKDSFNNKVIFIKGTDVKFEESSGITIESESNSIENDYFVDNNENEVKNKEKNPFELSPTITPKINK